MRAGEATRPTSSRAVRGVSALMLVLLPCLGQAQTPTRATMTIDSPAEALGDGKTTILVPIRLPAAADAEELEGISVDVNAGRVASKRVRLDAASLEVEIVPPRVIEPFGLVVEARSRHGQLAKAVIALSPALPINGVRVSNGPLGLQVPDQLVLGQDPQGTLSLRQSSLSPVIFYASAGTVSRSEKHEDGRLNAIYTPPEDKLPQVVLIVAASEDGALLDWAPIRLVGRPLLKTFSEPRAAILARVGGEDFGPIRSDRRGNVEIRVLAQPGVDAAQAVVRDAAGNERSLRLNLGVPNGTTVFSVCPPASEAFFFFAVDADGKPRPGLEIQATSSLGSLATPRHTEAGYYQAQLSLPGSAKLGEEFVLEGKILDEDDSRSRCATSVVGESPARIQLASASTEWVAGTGRSVRVVAKMAFSGVRKPRVVPLRAVAEFGEISPFVPQTVDTYQAEWRLPAQLMGRQKARLSVTTESAHPVQGELVLLLRPGAPATLKAAFETPSLKADGRSETQLIATVLDANGNPVDAKLEVNEGEGRLTPFATKSTGVYSATYEAPESATRTGDDITIRVASSSVMTGVHVALMPTFHRFRVWGGIGYSSNFGRVSGPMASIGAGLRLPWMGERLSAGLDASFLSSAMTTPDSSGQEEVTLRMTILPLAARVTYEFPFSRFKPYVGAGAGMGAVQVAYSSPSAGEYRHLRMPSLFLGNAGVLVRIGPGLAWFELAYRHMSLNMAEISGNVGGFSATAGYAYEF